MSLSLFDSMAKKPEAFRTNWAKNLPLEVAEELKFRPWWYVGRPEQQTPEGDWMVWLILSGRGWGKTRTGAEWLASEVLNNPFAPDGAPSEFAIIAETFGDTRIMCVDGPSGILRVLESRGLVNGVDFTYNKSVYQIWFKDGQKIHMFGADNPDAGRGYNLSGVWADEIAKWRYSYDSWYEGIAPALRIGKHPRAVITTTPKPIKILRDWVTREDGSVHVTRGSTFDNQANLSKVALAELKVRYEGTRLGRQELYGELLEDAEGALWKRGTIDASRVDKYPPLTRVVTAVDPAVTSGSESDETGIITAGVAHIDGIAHYYILADDSLRATPDGWGNRAIQSYHSWKSNIIVAEANNGGDMIISLLSGIDPSVPTRKVHASRGKEIRAEPISSLYEQGRVHHVGSFNSLEDQMVTWVPKGKGRSDVKSPDRLDALVWALTELSIGGSSMIGLAAMSNMCSSCGMPSAKSAEICFNCGERFERMA